MPDKKGTDWDLAMEWRARAKELEWMLGKAIEQACWVPRISSGTTSSGPCVSRDIVAERYLWQNLSRYYQERMT